MGPQRLDRTEMRSRLAYDAAGWVVDELADAFEPAFLSFRRKVDEAAKKAKRRAKPKPDDRRPRIGRPAEGDDS